uniref:Integrin alpha-2 domain-containing protein n=1 Tax=Strigamia maritima TaxID=126957 RepID=T1INB8_STRMM
MSLFQFQSNLLILLLLLYNAYQAEMYCQFEGYRAACNVYLRKGVMTKVTAVINHCNVPIDVTFFIKSDEPQVEWDYTFISTNPPQSEAISGFTVPVLLSVDLEKKREQIVVKANFHVNEFKDVPLLNNKIQIKSFADCAFGFSPKNTGHIIIGVVLTLLLFAVSGSIICWICYRRKKTGAELVALVDDMEAESSQPSSSTSTSTIRLSDVRNSDCESPA